MSATQQPTKRTGRVLPKNKVSLSSSSSSLPVLTDASGSQSTLQLSETPNRLAITPVPLNKLEAMPEVIDTPPQTPRSEAGDDKFTKEYIAEVPDLMTSTTFTWLLEPNTKEPQQTIFMCKCGDAGYTMDLTLPLQINYGMRKYPSRYAGNKPDVASTPLYLGGSYIEGESYRWCHGDVYKLSKVDELRANINKQLACMYEMHQRYLAVQTGVPEDNDTLLQGPAVKAGEISTLGIDTATVVPAMEVQVPADGKVKYSYKVILPVKRGTPHVLLHGQTPGLTLFTNKLSADSKSEPVKGLRVVDGLEDLLKRYNVIMKGKFTIGIEQCTKGSQAQGTRQPFRAGLLPISAVLILLPKSDEDLARWREGDGPQHVSDAALKVLSAADTFDGQI